MLLIFACSIFFFSIGSRILCVEVFVYLTEIFFSIISSYKLIILE